MSMKFIKNTFAYKTLLKGQPCWVTIVSASVSSLSDFASFTKRRNVNESLLINASATGCLRNKSCVSKRRAVETNIVCVAFSSPY